jgi:hypothetical protein
MLVVVHTTCNVILRDMSSPVLTGACGCGAVRFELSEPLVFAMYCHCTRCQRRTGTAAAASAAVAPGSLSIVQGDEQVRVWAPEGGFQKAFCGQCGSGLWSINPDNPEQLGVRLGAIDGDPGIRPAARQFVASAAAWEDIPDDGLPRFPERRTA